MDLYRKAQREIAIRWAKITVGIVFLFFISVLSTLFANQDALLAQPGDPTPSPVYVQPAIAVEPDETPTAQPTRVPRQLLIVGGEDAAVGELPWQVLVLPGPYMCGGSLITAEWVVTAAHCVVDDFDNPMPPSAIQVRAGEYNRSQNDGTEQQRGVSTVIVHPSYNSPPNDNDIALLRLASPVTFGPSVAPIPLVSSPEHDPLVVPGVMSLVSGWGATSEGGSTATILQKVRVPIVSNATCNAAYGGGITASMLCAGFAEGGKDSCQGDSGGPLVVPEGNGWRLAGVVSFGTGCARPNLYGVYARVSSFTSWIISNVGELPTPVVTPTTPTATSTATPSTPTMTPTVTPTVTGTPPTATATPPRRTYLPLVNRANTPTPTLTPTPTVTLPAPSNPIVNPGFEQGRGVGWQEYSRNGWTLIMNSGFPSGFYPHGGQWATWLGGDHDEISYIRQNVAIPTNASILSYWAWIASEDMCGYDFGGVIVNSTVASVFDLCTNTSTGGWVRRTVNLGAYAGQTVALQLRVETDGSLNSNLFIDDVSLTNVAGSVNLPVPMLAPGAEQLANAKYAAVVDRDAPAAAPEERLWTPAAEQK